MVFNTVTVAGVVTPAVIQTFLSHYLTRKKQLEHKPTAHISYDEGLSLVKKFLLYASHHTVEDVQRFTSQWVPTPRWVKLDGVQIPETYLAVSAEAIQAQLGPHGIEWVGGKTWWQWRRPGSEMSAEWIEMRADFHQRQRENDSGKRVMLYVHGGAYFFGSVDVHRYQLQRHARKLNARVFAPRYRLAPQFPFPCGLHDCLSAYLYLLTIQDPSTIIVAGDSAGGGMVLSMLVTLRDQGIPMPAGAILISPWVDLTHSFPSVTGDSKLDYIPPHGFHQRPSPSWPPPNAEDMRAMKEAVVKGIYPGDHDEFPQETAADAARGFHVDQNPDPETQNATAATDISTGSRSTPVANTVPTHGSDLSIMINGKLVEIKDQIQMYTTNQLLAHPLVSPALQPSLGGLPPLLILVGGGELLRDEQIYIAHKAAHPARYPPGDVFLDEVPHERNRDHVKRWKPTDVQLQVWDDLCHVAPTLSFTRPAKYMFRSVAQFGAWALARAQKSEIDIVDDDAVSVISKSDSESEDRRALEQKQEATASVQIGKAGDPLPHFKRHMIRQRVDRHGHVSELDPESELPGCNVPVNEVGVIKEMIVVKWMATRKNWDTKFSPIKRKVQKQRATEYAKGYQQFGDGEIPPPSALAGRRALGGELKEEKRKRSTALSIWALWGSKHDEEVIQKEMQADQGPDVIVITPTNDHDARTVHQTSQSRKKSRGHSRSRSRRRIVTDERQTCESDIDEDTPAAVLHHRRTENRKVEDSRAGHLTPDFLATSPNINAPPVDETELKRPKLGGIAFPFSLKQENGSASMLTLVSSLGVKPAANVRTDGAKDSGVVPNETDLEAARAARRSSAIQQHGNEASQRPPYETFVSAVEKLPTMSSES